MAKSTSVNYLPDVLINKKMTKEDYVIICGDFGLVWDNSNTDKYWQKWLSDKPFTTIFCDGNHENFDLLSTYPVAKFHGAKAHIINDSIYHIMRGEIAEIDGKKFFFMGGAQSHDKQFREEGESWWADEMPNADECKNATENLERNDYKVDYVITHCCPSSIAAMIGRYKPDELTKFFESLLEKGLEFNKWYFGHYHEDKIIMNKFECKYYTVERIL